MKRRRWLTLSIAPRWYLQGFQSLLSSQTWEAVLVLPETLGTSGEGFWTTPIQLRNIRYPLSAICHTHP